MSASPNDRTYDRDEVDLILRAAAQLDQPVTVPATLQRDGLSLADIQAIGSQAGITADAIAAASLTIAFDDIHRSGHRWHHVHSVPGEITGEGWDTLAHDIRGAVASATVRQTSSSIEFEVGKQDRELGRLLVHIKSSHGATTISIWSDAPHLSQGDIVAAGVFGMPVPIFPLVATSSGIWPEFGITAALAAAGAALGSGAALAWQRWATNRWKKRVAALLTPVVARAAALAAQPAGRIGAGGRTIDP